MLVKDLSAAVDALQVLLREAEEYDVPQVQRLRVKLHLPKISVAVVALVKAGKSTLLNALLGDEFLPSAALPATASITRIRHSPDEPQGRLLVLSEDGGEEEYEGRIAIHKAIHDVNNRRRQSNVVAAAPLLLHAPVLCFEGKASAGGVELLDTPGACEHGAGLEVEISHVLQDADVLLYVLDYTKLGSNDEARMFETLCESVQPLLESTSTKVQRMWFILNKVDRHSKRNDQPMDQVRDHVAQKIQRLLPRGVSVTWDHVLPISATNALLARMVSRRGAEDTDFLEDFLRQAMGECYQDEVDHKDYLQTALKKAKGLEDRSGLHELEKTVLPQVLRQKQAIQLLSLCDGLERLLTSLANQRLQQLGAARATVQELREALCGLQRTRDCIDEQLAELDSRIDGMRGETRAVAKRLLDELLQDVCRTVDVVFSEMPSGHSGSAVQMFFEKVRALFGDRDRLEASSKEQLDQKIREANSAIAALLVAKMDHCRANIYRSMQLWLVQLQEALDQAANPLLAQLATEGSRTLKVKLHAETLEPPPAMGDMASFQAAMEQNMQRMIQKKVEEVTRTRTEWVTKHGACNSSWSEPQKHTETSTETVGFHVSRDGLKQQWKAEITKRMEVSAKSADLLIQSQVGAEVERVRQEVRLRCSEMLASMQEAMGRKEESSQVEEEAALDLEAEVAKLDALLERLGALRADLQGPKNGQGLVPCEGPA